MVMQSDLPAYSSNAEYLSRLDKVLSKGKPGQPGYLLKRITRYTGVCLIWIALIWVPILGYLGSAPPKYTSTMSLILPGSGVSASVNMEGIGQASSFASSAFASNSLSPTQTYKRLLRADRILDAAATSLMTERQYLPRPKVTLVDQTGLIHVEMTGVSPEEARDRNQAILTAFFTEVEALRADDLEEREEGAVKAIEEYRDSVLATRQAVNNLQTQTGFISKDQFDRQVTDNDNRQTEVVGLRAELEEKVAFVAQMQAALGLTPLQAARALDLYSDQRYLALVADLADKATLRNEVGALYGARHPERQKAETDYARAFEATVDAAMAVTGLPRDVAEKLNVSQFGDRTSLLAELLRNEAERAGLEAQYLELNRRYMQEKNRLERAALAASKLEDLQRDFQVAEAVFASAIARAQSSKTDVFASYPLVQVLENPSLPEEGTASRKKMALLAGFGATFLVLMALSLGWVRKSIIRWAIGLREGPTHV
ncbi:GumC family protein [Cognatishimia activa]|uniref:Capsule polysaccharide export protein n=1 Tax=Cognatishimia activa TaxID=1715691 RepID=A0A0P1ISA7_9RHOB|nr:hypothetical protein [Cognatishimia activa]CUI68157.1 Capsule polysaccharide export protein [Cognatishimia activa]CUK26497.1 Capsule polysaccharide export protein [Cognatishimia activa]